jgi:hypothetical protein
MNRGWTWTWAGGATLLGLVTLGPVASAQPVGSVPPGPAGRMPPHEAQARTEMQRLHLKQEDDGSYSYRGPIFDAHIAKDGSVKFSPRSIQLLRETDPRVVGIDTITPQDPLSGEPPPAIVSAPGVRFDLYNEYMRAMGHDPARVEKAQFLAATFDVRMRMAALEQHAEKQKILADLPARLAQMWNDPRYSAAERRHLVLALWDDLADGPDADAARVIILTFAVDHMPSADIARMKETAPPPAPGGPTPVSAPAPTEPAAPIGPAEQGQ